MSFWTEVLITIYGKYLVVDSMGRMMGKVFGDDL